MPADKIICSQTLTRDVENRLTAVSGGASFVYDGDGSRVKKIEGGVTTLYIEQVLTEMQKGRFRST